MPRGEQIRIAGDLFGEGVPPVVKIGRADALDTGQADGVFK